MHKKSGRSYPFPAAGLRLTPVLEEKKRPNGRHRGKLSVSAKPIGCSAMARISDPLRVPLTDGLKGQLTGKVFLSKSYSLCPGSLDRRVRKYIGYDFKRMSKLYYGFVKTKMPEASLKTHLAVETMLIGIFRQFPELSFILKAHIEGGAL